MKLSIDTESGTLSYEQAGATYVLDLYSPAAFQVLSRQWLRLAWQVKYCYTFSWFGRPIIQLPADIVRVQEVVYRVKPDVIVETGVAHGGSLVLYASLLKAMGGGRVIGVDIEIRPHNRQAIEEHELADQITLIEGDSAGARTVAAVQSLIAPGEAVLVILDSCHTQDHVSRELEAYFGLVTPGSYIVATDGAMQFLYDLPRGEQNWEHNHPSAAAEAFAAAHPEFVLEQPPWLFNESELSENVTFWPQAFLRRTAV